MTKPKLELFKYDSCPFCLRVMSIIEKNSLDVDYRDISQEPTSLARLEADTGKRTVPCLYIDNKPMFESADIIAWLMQNATQLKK
jgi:glutaredoxin